jgi:YVTN family beta-propeller protein
VANYGACGLGGCDDVTPIDTATNTAESPIYIFGCSFPHLIAITPNGATAYVPCGGISTVVAIDTATNSEVDRFRVGNSPDGVAITPNGTTAYVSNLDSNTVTPVNLTTNTPGTPIKVASLPFGIAISPDQAPVAHLSVAPAEAGQPTSFDAYASTVAFGTISSYAWDFGDGSTATTSVPTTTHTYATPGPYTATVTETDSAGTSTTQVFTGQTMSNNGGPSAVTSQQLTVVPPLAITTTSVPNGSIWSKTNKAKYSTSLAATGGNPPYKWSLATGSSPLPPGLKLNPEGKISGKATTAGTYSFFTVQVVDTKAKTKPRTQDMATATLSITIS